MKLQQEHPVMTMIRNIDAIKRNTVEPKKLQEVREQFIYTLMHIKETLGNIKSLEKNPLYVFLKAEIVLSVSHLQQRDTLTLHTKLLNGLRLCQLIKKFATTFCKNDETLFDQSFKDLSDFFINLNQTEDKEKLSLSSDQIKLFLNTSLNDLAHYQQNKIFYYKEVVLEYQFLLQEYEKHLEKANEEFREVPAEAEKKAKKKIHYYEYIVNVIKNSITVVDEIIVGKQTPETALEQLYCNSIINENGLLAAAQEKLQNLLMRDIASPDKRLTQKKSYYVALNYEVMNFTVHDLFEKIYKYLESQKGLFSWLSSGPKAELSNDLSEALKIYTEQQNIISSIENNTQKLQALNLTTAKILDKLVLTYLASESTTHRNFYYSAIVSLLNILTHPLNSIDDDIKKRLRFLLTHPEINNDSRLQEKISHRLFNADTGTVSYDLAKFNSEQITRITRNESTQQDLIEFSNEQVDFDEFLNNVPRQLNDLNQQIKKQIANLPSAIRNKYQETSQTSASHDSKLKEIISPWNLLTDFIERQEMNSWINRFTEVHRKTILTGNQTLTNEFQRVFVELSLLNNLFGKIFFELGYPINKMNLFQATSHLITILTSPYYLIYIKDLLTFSAGRKASIHKVGLEFLTTNQFIVLPILSTMESFEGHFKILSSFFSQWCQCVAWLTTNKLPETEISALTEIYQQLKCLLSTYEIHYQEESNRLSRQLSGTPLENSVFLVPTGDIPSSITPKPLVASAPVISGPNVSISPQTPGNLTSSAPRTSSNVTSISSPQFQSNYAPPPPSDVPPPPPNATSGAPITSSVAVQTIISKSPLAPSVTKKDDTIVANVSGSASSTFFSPQPTSAPTSNNSAVNGTSSAEVKITKTLQEQIAEKMAEKAQGKK